MLIPLVERLRCPKPHRDTWLVASIDRAADRDILEGALGCPECMSEYVISDGIVYFDESIERPPYEPPNEAQATRLAAALELVDPRMVALLHGQWAAHAMIMRGLSPVPLLLVNPPLGVTSGNGISIVVASHVGIAATSMDALAIASDASDEMTASLLSALKPGKRVVMPASTTLLRDFNELARDDDIVVAELDAVAVTSPPILPTRRAR